MKKIYTLIILFSSFFQLNAQITITDNDMPNAGDTIRVSIGQITAAVDPIPTGANYTWDFSTLQWTSQTVDTFLSISQTDPTYQLIFANVSFNPNRANLAARGTFPIPPVPGLTITDIYSFYYSSSASYKQVGFGANINGFATPAPYNNKDFIYNFPLNYNDTDSSDSDFSLSIPGLGYYGFAQHRVNNCEGWGTLITPYGSFNVLKIKSTLNVHDSVYVDSLGFGFGADRPVANEYKWLGTAQGIPLLQINTTITLGTETVTSIVYRDSIRTPLSVAEINSPLELFAVFPNPSMGNFAIMLSLKKTAKVEGIIYNATGEKVTVLFDETTPVGQTVKTFNIKSYRLASGVYTIQLTIDGAISFQKLVITD